MEDTPQRRNEWEPYDESSVPYYEYSSVARPSRPLDSPALPPLAQQPPLWQSPGPPNRPRNRRLALIMAVVSILVIVALVFLTGPLQALFRQPAPVKTAVPVPATKAPTTTTQSQPTPTASFRSAPCPFQPGAGIVEGQMLRCGYVTVPENRADPNGAKVQLAVAIFKSPNVQNDPDPVVRLDGGPGGPSLDDWAKYVTAANYSTFVFNHDLIMFDQRGTGYSTPSLNCPETLQLQYNTLDQHLSSGQSTQLELQALSACRNRLVKEGVDLNAFNSLEDAADVRDLIVALGYKQANLYGVSYGTRLALTTMRLYPSVIRSVVLDSVYPPQENRTDLPAAAQRVFNTLFQGCAAETFCNTTYPHLDSVFYQLVTDLNAKPISFETIDDTSGKSYQVMMAGDDFVWLLFSALYVTQYIPDLPQMIFQVRAHNYELLSQIYGSVEFDNTFSDGMFYSDECSEDWDFLTQSDIAPALQGIAPQIRSAMQGDLQQEYASCKLWNVQKAPAAQKQAVVSDIPTLVLSDEYDPITPPANGKLAAQTLKNSYYFLFPGLGHGAEYNSSCVDSIISAFDDNPTQKPPSACIASMGEPDFV